MKKIIRLTESDLTRIVRRVIQEQEGGNDPQDPTHHFDTVEKALIPKGFKKNISMLKSMGSEDLIYGGSHGGIIVRYYSPVHPESKKKGYVVELIVNNASKKKWGNGANMYEVIKEVEKYLKPKGVTESRIVRRVIQEQSNEVNIPLVWDLAKNLGMFYSMPMGPDQIFFHYGRNNASKSIQKIWMDTVNKKPMKITIQDERGVKEFPASTPVNKIVEYAKGSKGYKKLASSQLKDM